MKNISLQDFVDNLQSQIADAVARDFSGIALVEAEVYGMLGTPVVLWWNVRQRKFCKQITQKETNI